MKKSSIISNQDPVVAYGKELVALYQRQNKVEGYEDYKDPRKAWYGSYYCSELATINDVMMALEDRMSDVKAVTIEGALIQLALLRTHIDELDAMNESKTGRQCIRILFSVMDVLKKEATMPFSDDYKTISERHAGMDMNPWYTAEERIAIAKEAEIAG